MENNLIFDVLESQYKAALSMLRSALEKVPQEYWNSKEYNKPIWQLAFHTLYGTKMYLSSSPETFILWENAIRGAESLGGVNDWENPEEDGVIEGTHTPSELFDFIDDIVANLQQNISALPIHEPSGFEWYPVTRLELHLTNIRHIQHHAAQIIERLKYKNIHGFAWAIDGNPAVEWS